MTSCSLKALSPNTVTLRVKALTYELGGGLEDGVGHDSAITPCSPRLTGNHPSSWVSLSWSLNSCPASLATNRSQKLCENRPILKQAKINPGCGDDGYLGELETRRSSDKGFWEGVSWSGSMAVFTLWKFISLPPESMYISSLCLSVPGMWCCVTNHLQTWWFKAISSSIFFSSICHLSGLDKDNISLHQSMSAGAEPRLGTRISRRLDCSHVLLVGETFIGTWLEHPYGASLGGRGFSQHGDCVPRLSRGRWKPYCLSWPSNVTRPALCSSEQVSKLVQF